MQFNQNPTEVAGHYEAGMIGHILRACRACGSPHPRAIGLKVDSCPKCGTLCEPEEVFDADQTVITGGGFRLNLAKAFLKVGALLNKAARKL